MGTQLQCIRCTDNKGRPLEDLGAPGCSALRRRCLSEFAACHSLSKVIFSPQISLWTRGVQKGMAVCIQSASPPAPGNASGTLSRWGRYNLCLHGEERCCCLLQVGDIRICRASHLSFLCGPSWRLAGTAQVFPMGVKRDGRGPGGSRSSGNHQQTENASFSHFFFRNTVALPTPDFCNFNAASLIRRSRC